MVGMEAKIYSQTFTVGFFEVDAKLCMAPVAYWRILQSAAASHATLLEASTEALRLSGQTWMLSKMRLDILHHPRIGDIVTIETWPATGSKAARAHRDFVLKNAEGEICASASCLWVIVNLATRRPVRIPESILAHRHDPGYSIPQLMDATMAAPTNPQLEASYRALWSDADQNEHVNNVAMLRWAVDSLPLAFLETHELIHAEVHYRSEVRIGDIVDVLTKDIEGQIQQVVLNSTGAPVANILTKWSNPA